MDLDVDRLNQFWIRANPSQTFRCINKTTLDTKDIRSFPTSNIVSYPANPCILDIYTHKIIEGFTLCYEKTISPAIEAKLLHETPTDLKEIVNLFVTSK
jgi:hypothetical protein